VVMLLAALLAAFTSEVGAQRNVALADRPVEVSIPAVRDPATPGGVVLLTVLGADGLREVKGSAKGRPVPFWTSDTSRREWHGLLGLGLDTRPGAVVVAVESTALDGRTVRVSTSVRVVAKRYATRRIQVEPRLANPPPEEAARIERESKAMAMAFAQLTPERLWHGPFETPVPGTATSSFGRLTITNGNPGGRHQGADFRAATGTPVKAPNGGRVVLAQDLYFAGNTVILDHGLGVFSLLAHLSRIAVRVGDVVSRGDLLGDSGATGRVTGPHLHWAVRFGQSSVDPVALMSAVAQLTDDGVKTAAQ